MNSFTTVTLKLKFYLVVDVFKILFYIKGIKFYVCRHIPITQNIILYLSLKFYVMSTYFNDKILKL